MTEQKIDGQSKSFTDLPPHLIENILSYCFCDRFSLKLVCKAFYDAIWKIFGEHFKLIIDNDDDEYKKKISSILNGSIADCRQVRFSNVEIRIYKHPPFDFGLLSTFFEARGEFVKNLKLNSSFPADQGQRIVSHTRNLRKLSVPCMKLDLSELMNLSEIEVSRTNGDVLLRDVKLPNHSIKTIKINVWNVNEDDLCEFLANQNFIERLEFEVGNFEFSSNFFERILISTSKLRILKIFHEISDEYLKLITQNMQHLEELHGNFNQINAEYFDTLARLQKLKILRIFCKNPEKFFLSDSKLQVSSLSISSDGLTAETARQIARKFPKLTKFYFNKFLNHFKVIPEVFSHFQHLEELKFNLVDSPRVAFSPEIKNVSNANLKVLSIEKLTKQDLKYLKSFPNLTKLSLKLSNGRKDGSFKDAIEGIFQDFPKLREISLKFTGTYQMDFDIIDLVNKHPNLELIYFGNLSLEPKTMKISELKRRFEITHVSADPIFKKRSSLLFIADADIFIKNQLSYSIPRCAVPSGLKVFASI